MDELRRDLRAAFEREQASLGSLPGARERVMGAALATPAADGRRPSRLAAGVVVVLLAVAIVGTLVLVRGAGRAHPVPVATPAAPVRKHLTQPLRVAPEQPVIMFRDPADATQIDGTTWDGSGLGRVGPATRNARLDQDPTGTLYEANNEDVRDRSGRVLGPFEQGQVSRTWADDGRHYCWIDPVTPVPPARAVPATLQLRAPGEQPRAVAQVGTEDRQSGIQVIACSVRRDRAVVVQASAQGAIAAQVWVVELSTGRIVWASTYPNEGVTQVTVVASPDGRYVAEVRSSCCLLGTPRPASTTVATTVYDTMGSGVGHVAGNVEAFSWDGSLALVRPTANVGPAPYVVRWRDGGVVWRAPGSQTYLSAIAEPGGQRLAVTVKEPPATPFAGTLDVYVVGPSGQERLLLSHL